MSDSSLRCSSLSRATVHPQRGRADHDDPLRARNARAAVRDNESDSIHRPTVEFLAYRVRSMCIKRRGCFEW